MTKTININQIKNYLPHRYPFLLLDRVLSYEPSKRLIAIKNVTYNENFFAGHFVHRPIMPGVLIAEAMAQAAALLGRVSMDANREELDAEALYLLVGFDKLRFRRIVEPGDQLLFTVDYVAKRREMYRFDVSASVDDQIAASGSTLITLRESDT